MKKDREMIDEINCHTNLRIYHKKKATIKF